MEHVAEPNFIATLGLNWKLFIAQLVNFGIVIFILWKWVFKPVAGALEARRKKIEDSVRQAQEIETRLKELEKYRSAEMIKARAEAAAVFEKLRSEAASESQEIVAASKAEADRIFREAKTAITAAKEKMFAEIREEVATLTVMAVEKILREKLDEQKDKELVGEILAGLRK